MASSPVSCGATCSRITLVSLNLIFMLCGLAFLILGCIFRFGSDELKDDVEPALREVEFSGQNAYDLFSSAAIIFIVVGVFILVIAILGFIGALCTAKWALYIYAFLVGLIIAVELAGVILFLIFQGEVDEALKLGLKKSIQRANTPIDEFQVDNQNAVEYMIRIYKCCHVEGQRLRNYNDEYARQICSYNSYAWSEDCHASIRDWVKKFSVPLIVIGICVIIIQLFMIVFACCVIRAYRKEELV